MSTPLSTIFGPAPSGDQAAVTELLDEAAEPDTYRPYIIRARAQVGFTVIEADGTRHGFQFHTLRHPKHQVRGGEEFLSFHADGIAVVMQGKGLVILHSALVRATVAEMREYDGKQPMGEFATTITQLRVEDTQQRVPQSPPRLVK